MNLDNKTTKIENIFNLIKELTVSEMMELTKKLSDSFGIPIELLMSSSSNSNKNIDGQSGSVEDKAEEKLIFDVKLVSVEESKTIGVIRFVKEQLGLDLMKAKTIVSSTPVVLFEKLEKAKAEDMKSKLETLGAVVTLI